MKQEAKMFGLVSKAGQIRTSSEYRLEKEAWYEEFGCQTQKSIDYMKHHFGWRCVVMTITWEEPER